MTTQDENDSLTLFARFDNPTTAHLVRSILESHDIPCFVLDHLHGGMNWDVYGAVRLMLMKSDFDAAKQLLKDENIDFEKA